MDKVHIPRGSMCASCAHKLRNCSGLDFSKMQELRRHKNEVIVRCSEYKRVQ